MKENIHPQYGKCVVRCVCGETFETGSTKKEMKVDIINVRSLSLSTGLEKNAK